MKDPTGYKTRDREKMNKKLEKLLGIRASIWGVEGKKKERNTPSFASNTVS